MPIDLKKMKAEVEALRAKASELILKDPKKAATILTAWLNSPLRQHEQGAAQKPTSALNPSPTPSIKQLKKKAG
jgi:hypothetical protein